jgi:hypothetical protein
MVPQKKPVSAAKAALQHRNNVFSAVRAKMLYVSTSSWRELVRGPLRLYSGELLLL